MLQIDHVYEFLYQSLFKDFEVWHTQNGVFKQGNITKSDISVFTPGLHRCAKMFFNDQEPFIPQVSMDYLKIFVNDNNKLSILVTSEYSREVSQYTNNGFKNLYYFFHGFAALDWYRGYYALNYSKSVVKDYGKDYITYNRIINHDRSYRIYFISQLIERGLLDHGLISFGVTDYQSDSWQDEVSDPQTKLSKTAIDHILQHLNKIPNRLIIDYDNIHGSASANIPRTVPGYWPNNDQPNVDALWHIVTETVFYYDKLHLTEKIFKPIVSKQPFMLMSAPGSLAYLQKYGFKTFNGIIDESYDNIKDSDLRINAIVAQLDWYCRLSDQNKIEVILAVNDIVEYNFHHFYGEFKHIITQELLDNTKSLFKEIGYNDSTIAYDSIYRVLTN